MSRYDQAMTPRDDYVGGGEGGSIKLGLEDDDMAFQATCEVWGSDWAKMSVPQQVRKLKYTHWCLMILYLAGAITYLIFTCVTTDLQGGRFLPVNLNIIQPPAGAYTWTQHFTTHTLVAIARLPPTIIITIVAFLNCVYHGTMIWNRWTAPVLDEQQNSCRWIFYTASKILITFLFFAYNGETELTSFLFLAAAIAGICFAGHKMEVACGYYHKKMGRIESEKGNGVLMSTCKWVVDNERVIVAISSVVLTAFFLRLGYNGRATPNWVFGMSIAYGVVEAVAIVYWVRSIAGTRCNEPTARAEFAHHEWNFYMWNLVAFIPFSIVAFVMQDKM